METELQRLIFDLFTPVVPLLTTAVMAGVFAYKFRKGWIALWITTAPGIQAGDGDDQAGALQHRTTK